MKKLFAFSTIIALGLFFAGCDKKTDESKSESKDYVDNPESSEDESGGEGGRSSGESVNSPNLTPPGEEDEDGGEGHGDGKGHSDEGHSDDEGHGDDEGRGDDEGHGDGEGHNDGNRNPPPRNNPDRRPPASGHGDGEGGSEGHGDGGRSNPDGDGGRSTPGGEGEGGDGEGGDGQTQAPPTYPEGSAEDAVVQFVLNLNKKDYKQVQRHVSPKATGRVKSLRSNSPDQDDLKALNALLARVKFYRPKAVQRRSGEHAVILINDRGQIIQFKCRKEGDAFAIREIAVPKIPRRRR